MEELIKRLERVIQTGAPNKDGMHPISAEVVLEVVKQLPPAQPKKGRWISADAMFGGVPFYCSECGENTRDTVMGKPRWKFCPMCGSYNGGEKDDSV